MRTAAAVVAALAISFAGLVHAQPKDAQPKDAPPKDAPPISAKIDAVAWLKGYWAGDGYGGQVETLMGPPRAGVMLGYFRHIKPDGKAGFYELCAIEEYEGTLRFVIKHFHPNWIGWEEKDHALQAKLTKVSKNEAVFANMTIRRTGKDRMVMELAIGGKDGTSRTEVLRLKRLAL